MSTESQSSQAKSKLREREMMKFIANVGHWDSGTVVSGNSDVSTGMDGGPGEIFQEANRMM